MPLSPFPPPLLYRSGGGAGWGKDCTSEYSGIKIRRGQGVQETQPILWVLVRGMKTIYPSMSGVGKALGVPSGSIRMYFSSNTLKPYKGRYLLQKLAGNYKRGFHTIVVKEQRVDGS